MQKYDVQMCNKHMLAILDQYCLNINKDVAQSMSS